VCRGLSIIGFFDRIAQRVLDLLLSSDLLASEYSVMLLEADVGIVAGELARPLVGDQREALIVAIVGGKPANWSVSVPV
jgi:hypothetical protein